jgi:SAM-dependent methyltransferase
MEIDYNHNSNRHTLTGPRALLPVLFKKARVLSLLDVGCGTGTWSSVAMELGVRDVLGIDGVSLPAERLLIPRRCFKKQDLTEAWNFQRRFDLALCLEVAEHLEAKYAETLIGSLTAHSDVVAFSAACPGQAGQHHVNCHWPSYWQTFFNAAGFYCDDAIRWENWNELSAEPWYRQNLFLAFRNAEKAGHEPRLRPVIHPEFLFGTAYEHVTRGRFSSLEFIETGGMPVGWYLKAPLLGLLSKVTKRIWRGARMGKAPALAGAKA